MKLVNRRLQDHDRVVRKYCVSLCNVVKSPMPILGGGDAMIEADEQGPQVDHGYGSRIAVGPAELPQDSGDLLRLN